MEGFSSEFKNAYEDATRAAAYSKLEFPGTYYLAFRDLPRIVSEHVRGKDALDFGCGTGRSTRFLTRLQFAAIGADISAEMVRKAHEIDPRGDYRVLPEGDLSGFEDGPFDLVLCAFTFDNIPTMEKKVRLFTQLRRVLRRDGKIVNLVSSPEIYCHEWASFSTKDYPENRKAKCGDVVRIVNVELEDKRPVEDVIWPDADYRETYRRAGLELVSVHRPLGEEEEPYPWVNETRIAPWTIYVLGKKI